jgi:hypothetical protein
MAHTYDKAAKEHQFNIEGFEFKFRESAPFELSNGQIVEPHPDEQFSFFSIVPPNATGSWQNVWFSKKFKTQDVRAVLNAAQRSLYSPLDNPYVQINFDFDKDVEKYGEQGWIRWDQLSWEALVCKIYFTRQIRSGRRLEIESKTAFIEMPTRLADDLLTRVPDTEVRGEWLGLTRKSSFTWMAVWDTRTKGNGPVLASYRQMMHDGTAFTCTPTIGVMEDGTVLDKLQNNAKRFFSSLMAISNGELTVEEAGHQYFQDKKFISISYNNDVELDESDQEAMEENATKAKTGEAVTPMGVLVAVDWSDTKIEITELPSGNYVTNLNGADKYQENRSFFGRKRLLKAARNNEGLVLSKATI